MGCGASTGVWVCWARGGFNLQLAASCAHLLVQEVVIKYWLVCMLVDDLPSVHESATQIGQGAQDCRNLTMDRNVRRSSRRRVCAHHALHL